MFVCACVYACVCVLCAGWGGGGEVHIVKLMTATPPQSQTEAANSLFLKQVDIYT